MKELLLSEKYRPKKIEDIILLPRIKKIFEKGIIGNILFYGKFGTGKTTLARILVGKYTKDKPFIELNGSNDTSIDILRTKIDDFCSNVYMGLDIISDIKKDDTKYVLIDESERISKNFQDALKVYIEEYSAKNVRFIFITNHINKISEGLLSRITTKINFDCNSAEEEKFLKTSFYKRIIETISPSENIDIKKDDLIKIINRNFPDFRSIMNDIQNFKNAGEIIHNGQSVNLKLKNDLYSIVYDKSKTYEEIYHFLMDNFGAEKIDEMISLFGKDFILWSFSEKKEIDKLFQANYIISEYTKLLETNTDPIVLGMSVLGKMRDLFI